MTGYVLLSVVLLPILGGLFVTLLKNKSSRAREITVMSIVVVNTLLVYWLFTQDEASFTLIHFPGSLEIAFRMDGLSRVFGGLVSTLWPLATLYAFEYMKHEKEGFSENSFFVFYTMTYGVTMGIVMSGNILTMYTFYEMLTLVTVPLVMHTLSRDAIRASRKYMYYSLGGAAFAFIGMIFLLTYGETSDFVYGGVLSESVMESNGTLFLLVYVFSFMGFGVKAAVFPVNSWLPDAGVAPTPVTALLHAVAVVKAGAFAIIRITYYSFGTEFLKGSAAQYFAMIIAMFTIVYGCSMAVKERHIKRRLAYSTTSNLSYILFGAVLMSPLGLKAALAHMIFHGFMKITSFFCAGAVMCQSGKKYVWELDGIGRRMPRTMVIFTISALALMGVPGLPGFISKFYLAEAAVESSDPVAYIGIGCLLVSALLTAIYMLTISVRAFFPIRSGEGKPAEIPESVTDPGWRMQLVLTVLILAVIAMGLFSSPLLDFLGRVAEGLL